MTAIIDVFPYNGEPIVELRLKYLHPHVTEFVIVEARETHSGIPKTSLFIEKYADVFAPYLDKIRFIVIDKFPEITPEWRIQNEVDFPSDTESNWFRENYQRDIPMEYVASRYSNYIATVCDVDEIPSLDTLKMLVKRYDELDIPLHLEMQLFYYNFKWRLNTDWYYAFSINDRGVSKAMSEGTTFTKMRTTSQDVLYIDNAGWHGSFFMPTENIVKKIESFAHGELNRTNFKDHQHIRECIKNGLDVFERERHKYMILFDVSCLPEEFQEFQTNILFLQRYT